MKSDTKVIQENSAAATLEAPVRLTPEQLEEVAAGFAVQINRGGIVFPTHTTGLFPYPPIATLPGSQLVKQS